MSTRIAARFKLRIPEGTPGVERVVLGSEFTKYLAKDADGHDVLIIPTPRGDEILTIRSGMELTPKQAEAFVWYFTTLGGRRTSAL